MFYCKFIKSHLRQVNNTLLKCFKADRLKNEAFMLQNKAELKRGGHTLTELIKNHLRKIVEADDIHPKCHNICI